MTVIFSSNPTLEFILVSVAGLILGGISIGVLGLIWLKMSGYFLKKRIPLDKEKLGDPGKAEVNVEEVKKNERELALKFREFEKLRRYDISDKRDGTAKNNRGTTKRELDASRITELQGSSIRPTESNKFDSRVESGSDRGVRKDKKRFRLNRPDVI